MKSTSRRVDLRCTAVDFQLTSGENRRKNIVDQNWNSSQRAIPDSSLSNLFLRTFKEGESAAFSNHYSSGLACSYNQKSPLFLCSKSPMQFVCLWWTWRTFYSPLISTRLLGIQKLSLCLHSLFFSLN